MSKYHEKCTNSKPKRTQPPPQPAPPSPPERPKPDQTDLLAILNQSNPCSCEVVARAVSGDIPKYIGMQNAHNQPPKSDDDSEDPGNLPSKKQK